MENEDTIPRPSTSVEDNSDTPRGSLCYPPSSQASLARLPTELFASSDTPSSSYSSLVRAPTELLSASQQSQSSNGSSMVSFIINPNAQTGFMGNHPTHPTITTAGSSVQAPNDGASVASHHAGPSRAVRTHSSLYTPTHLNEEQLQALVLERQNEQEAMLRQLLEGRGVQIYSRAGETNATTLMRLAAQHIRSIQVPQTDATAATMHAIPAELDMQNFGGFQSAQLWS